MGRRLGWFAGVAVVVGLASAGACGGGGGGSGSSGTGAAGTGTGAGGTGATGTTSSGSTTSSGTGGGGPQGGALGATCQKNGDCDSGVCMTNGHCTAPCSTKSDCPAGPSWDCAPMPGHGSQCQCNSAGAETCDGFDDDCNTVVDDGATCSEVGYGCQQGECKCLPQNLCGGTCVDTQTDVQNCGSCGNAFQGGSCVNGVGSCPGQMGASCGGLCRDLASDTQNCGACGTSVAVGGSCVKGAPTCPGATGKACNGTCTDVATDALNCGDCGNACPTGATCAAKACVCPGTQVPCGGTCVDTSTSLGNCGGCGLTCPGSCAAGRCTSVLVAGEAASHMAVDATSVYWLRNNPAALVKAPSAGGSPTALATGGWSHIYRPVYRYLALNATSAVYYGEDSTEVPAIRTIDLAVGSPGQLSSDYPWAIAVDGSRAYWTDASNGGIKAADLAGGSAVTLVAGQAGKFWDLQVDATSIYGMRLTCSGMGCQEDLVSCGLAGGTPTTLWSHNVSTSQFTQYANLVLDDARIYWVYDTSLLGMDKGGGTPVTMATVKNGTSNTLQIAGDAASLYWADTAGTVWKVAKSGGTPENLGSGTAPIAVDATSLYFQGTAGIMKMTPK